MPTSPDDAGGAAPPQPDGAGGSASPDDAGTPDRPAWTVALFVAVSWAAVVFAIDGLVAVTTGRDPVPPGIDPYYGIIALAVAGVAVWLCVAVGVAQRSAALPALVTIAVVYLIIVLSGLADGLRLLSVQAVSPFTFVAAGLAGLAVVATRLALRARRRPRS